MVEAEVTPESTARQWAIALVDAERGSDEGVGALSEAAQRIGDKLARRLEPVFTRAGSDALWHRAVHLAATLYPYLASVRGTSSLDGLGEAIHGVDADHAFEGVTTLIANMIQLLITFIGPDLARRFIDGAWPGVLPVEPAGHEQESTS